MKGIYIHYPYAPSGRLDTMPFAQSTIITAARRLDHLYILNFAEGSSTSISSLFSSYHNITVLPLSRFKQTPFISFDLLKASIFILLTSIILRPKIIFALGQKGIVASGMATSVLHLSTVYVNDELPDGTPRVRKLENLLASRSKFIVVPDKCRIEPLAKELSINSSNHKFVEVINSPPVEKTYCLSEGLTTAFNFDKLGISIEENSNIVLNAGSIADWAQIPELMATARDWPDQFALLLHSRSGINLAYQKSLSHLRYQNIFWSNAVLSPAELAQLIGSCFTTVALYRNLGPNIEYIGKSSGKILNSIACGTPVICSNFHSLSFVEDHGLGFCVNHPSQIAACLTKINDNREFFAKNCFNFASDYLTESRIAAPLVDALKVLLNSQKICA